MTNTKRNEGIRITHELPIGALADLMIQRDRLKDSCTAQAHQLIALTEQRDRLREINAELRTTLERVITLTHNDAVNGHLFDGQEITQAGIEEIYETCRVALAKLKG